MVLPGFVGKLPPSLSPLNPCPIGVSSDRDRALLEPNLCGSKRTSDLWIVEVNGRQGSLAEFLKERGARLDDGRVTLGIPRFASIGTIFFVDMALLLPRYALETLGTSFWSLSFDNANRLRWLSLAAW